MLQNIRLSFRAPQGVLLSPAKRRKVRCVPCLLTWRLDVGVVDAKWWWRTITRWSATGLKPLERRLHRATRPAAVRREALTVGRESSEEHAARGLRRPGHRSDRRQRPLALAR